MPVEVHVTGRVQIGRLAEFLTAAERWQSFRTGHGLASSKILQALSGEMNAVRIVFNYPELGAYEAEGTNHTRSRLCASRLADAVHRQHTRLRDLPRNGDTAASGVTTA
jgi:hypothetical protein